MQRNKDELLRAMYEEYQGVLRRVARKAGVPSNDVEDVLQETFLAYYHHYSLTWKPSRKKAMLMKILKNKCADHFRRSKRQECVSIDAEDFDESEILTEYVMKDSLEYVVLDEINKAIREDIFSMKKEWKDIAVMGLVEERPLTEICEILELEYSVCKMRLSRIRKYLRERHGPKFRD